MLAHWQIRTKLQLGMVIMSLAILILASSAYYGLYEYRGLIKSLSIRADELPLANKLSTHAASLVQLTEARISAQEYHDRNPITQPFRYSQLTTSEKSNSEKSLPAHRSFSLADSPDNLLLFRQYDNTYGLFVDALRRYKDLITENESLSYKFIGDYTKEKKTLAEIKKCLQAIHHSTDSSNPDRAFNQINFSTLQKENYRLQRLSEKLASHLHKKLKSFATDVKTQYRAAIITAWTTGGILLVMLIVSILLFQKWILIPLRLLVIGSRRVAQGHFDHRIHLNTKDEMYELANAMNAMTSRFETIRDDLDRQVRQRTKQVVRSEQLASVGFLAAGVAHEINNPLASIALCSESLAGRLEKLLPTDEQHKPETEIIQRYLLMIQEEAFRCKSITEKLLDFSRLGDSDRHPGDLRTLVESVISMVQHLGKYRDKKVVLLAGQPIFAEINSQEIKQVILNLITNGLDNMDPGGRVTVTLKKRAGTVQLVVQDNGHGMTDEVKEHLFEPFFTRRKGSQGTGLGLSITYRIVEEHQGTLVAESAGPNKGSRFTVRIPFSQQQCPQRQFDQALLDSNVA